MVRLLSAFTDMQSLPSGYVGYVNMTLTSDGVQFIVRSSGVDPVTASHVIPVTAAKALLTEALARLENSDG